MVVVSTILFLNIVAALRILIKKTLTPLNVNILTLNLAYIISTVMVILSNYGIRQVLTLWNLLRLQTDSTFAMTNLGWVYVIGICGLFLGRGALIYIDIQLAFAYIGSYFKL